MQGRRWRFVTWMIAASLGVAASAAGSDPMTLHEFSVKVAEAIRLRDPNSKVELADDGVLRVETTGWTGTLFLTKHYAAYRRDPAALAEVLDGIVRSHLETIKSSGAVGSAGVAARMLPVLRSREWYETSQERLRRTGVDPDKALGSAVALNSALVLLIVEDRSETVRYLSAADVKSVGLSIEEARRRALENLRRLRPKIKIEGRDGRYRVVGDLQYESSLALDEAFLRGDELRLDGDPVIAVPSPGALFVTGARNRAGVESLRAVVQKLYTEAGPVGISPALFVWRQGQLHVLAAP